MRLRFTALLLFSSILASAQVHARYPVPSDDSVHYRLERYCGNLVTNNNFKGNILVTRNDSVLFAKSYGISTANNLDDFFAPNSEKFRKRWWIGSLTKQFTAVCILKLEEYGKLSTGDKLSKYFPQFQFADSITLHDMLCHRSGMYDFEDDVHYYDGIDKIMQRVARKTPRGKPGESFYYNDTPYLLLSLIVEKVSGQTFGDFLASHICYNLDLLDTGIGESKEDYKNIPNVMKPQELFAYQRAVQVKGAGGMISSALDLYLWDCALMDTHLLLPVSKKKMFTPYTDANDCPSCQSYGYGIEIDTIAGHLAYFHGGDLVGYHTYNMIFPNENVKIIVLRADEGSVFFSWALAGIVFDNHIRTPDPVTKTLPDSTYYRFYGAYSFTFSDTIADLTIFKKRGKIYAQWTGGEAAEVRPNSDSTLYWVNDAFQREILFHCCSALRKTDIEILIHGYAAREMYMCREKW